MSENSLQLNHSEWLCRFFTTGFGQAFSTLGSHPTGFAFVWHLSETTLSTTVLTIRTRMKILLMARIDGLIFVC
ncbi:MAG TPA: hypothetical protein PLA02_08745 [Brevefilum fermentans]|uniref:Uncharacterized protein n=1 Tax=Candidatus Brevifilum fermentans TaxID=1986204 RepID=A0A1Y6K232_9CHLR|nr:hypothetical protein [Brevefilum fermentans]MDI9565267.1 hypothetical protein [Chloroflexota bacterium]SMX53721.1 protein of unknown function [Brevefilum fermentans]HOM67763.1 hypothetical protein [Brevefilum fermentans]HPX96278.1 hypothetical protein [Brevefilum fermentans]HQA29284.1 hypothetical protein [Brevefilum fermentans]